MSIRKGKTIIAGSASPIDLTNEVLKKNQITNCLLEVPQNIKLELADGVLTLKAGSKVIVPNGFEANGTTPKFDDIVIERDTAVVCGNAGTRFCFVGRDLQCYDSDIKFLYSGATPPETPSKSARWYDTSSNLLKEYIDGVWVTSNNYYSLPFAICTADTNKIFTSINQIFNGMGYIGSTIWVDKGVKGLFPWGRNTDGTLNNIEGSTQVVKTYTAPSNYTNPSAQLVIDNANGIKPNTTGIACNGYREVEEIPTSRLDYTTWILHTPSNRVYQWNNTTSKYELKTAGLVAVVDVSITAGVITSFQPKLPFRAVDWNDIQDLGKGLPVGTVFSHTCSANFVPENSLPCNGSEYTQAQFPNLYNDWLVGGKLKTCTYTEYSNMLTTYGQCPMWALDTTNKKFKVPTIKDGAVVQQAMSNTEIGKAYNAGLPNITGSVGMGESYYTSGAFYKGTEQSGNTKTDGASDPSANFDASRSNSIYGNSDTVQMNAVALRYFVVVATKAISQSAMDWSQWASGISDKISKTECEAYITQTYVNGTSWYRIWSDGWCEQGGTVTNNATSLTVTFLKNFATTDYQLNVYKRGTDNDTGGYADAHCEVNGSSPYDAGQSVNGFRCSTISGNSKFTWEAKGYMT